jgi:hypothetical protein
MSNVLLFTGVVQRREATSHAPSDDQINALGVFCANWPESLTAELVFLSAQIEAHLVAPSITGVQTSPEVFLRTVSARLVEFALRSQLLEGGR